MPSRMRCGRLPSTATRVTSDQFKTGLAELRTEMAGQRAELTGQIAEQRAEVAEARTEIANLDTRLSTQIAEVRTEIASPRHAALHPDCRCAHRDREPRDPAPVRARLHPAAVVDRLARKPHSSQSRSLGSPDQPTATTATTGGRAVRPRSAPSTAPTEAFKDPWDIHAGEEAPSDDAKEKEAVAKRMRANWAERRKNAAK